MLNGVQIMAIEVHHENGEAEINHINFKVQVNTSAMKQQLANTAVISRK